MVGSLAAGFSLGAISGPERYWISLTYPYAVAAMGRAFGALLHFRLPLRTARGWT